ncbi:MAG: DUF192 domain-containing protein [Candidatus Paceibacterota bacterium]|jgi:hypothetical protein
MKILKKIFWVIIIIGFVILSIRFFSGNEDSWLCVNGQWIRHGNPDGAMPTTKCGDDTIATPSVNKIYVTQCGEYDKKEINFGEIKVFADVSDNNCKRELGLSGRSGLEEDGGMIFVFEQVGKYGFWMKDMKFSIDIIWITEDFFVSGIVGNFSPEDYPKVLGGDYVAKYVLEVPTGFAEKNNIKVGDKVEFVI